MSAVSAHTPTINDDWMNRYEEVVAPVLPGYFELGIVAGSFAFFAMLFLVFLKLFPVVAIAEVKEIAIHERMHRGGH